MLATKIWRLCRSLVNARGASYSLVFRAIFIKTIKTTIRTSIIDNYFFGTKIRALQALQK